MVALRLLAFSDIHGSRTAYEKAVKVVSASRPDLVLMAGDIADHNVPLATTFLQSFSTTGVPLFFVPGNMDDSRLANWKDTELVRCIHARCVYHKEIAFMGLAGFSGDGARILESALSSYTGGSIVLLSHSPPKNTKIDRVFAGFHAGSGAVRDFIQQKRPVLVVSGHIHEAPGTDKIGNSLLVNTGPARDGRYCLINLSKEVEVTFSRF